MSRHVKKKAKMQFSKVLALLILLGDIMLSGGTLFITYKAVVLNFSGTLPYLVSLITLFQFATGYVLGKYFDKSKAENTKGGIVYDTALPNITVERDC